MDWYPQQLFTAEQVAAGVSCFEKHAFLKNVSFSKYVSILLVFG